MKISNTPVLKTAPPILPTPPILWEKFDPRPFFSKISKTHPPTFPHPLPYSKNSLLVYLICSVFCNLIILQCIYLCNDNFILTYLSNIKNF